MNAYYYKIVEYNPLTCQFGGKVTEGIIRNAEDTIFPQQDTGIDELPYECEAHHFSHTNYQLQGFYISMTEELCERRRLN